MEGLVFHGCFTSFRFVASQVPVVMPETSLLIVAIWIQWIKAFIIAPTQPRPQGLLGVQNGGLGKTLANNRSRVSKNIGDFDCFKLAVGFVIG